MVEIKESKFTRMAEVLPNNAKTAKIYKERDELAQQKAERDKAVSIPTYPVLTIKWLFDKFDLSIFWKLFTQLKQAFEREENNRNKEKARALREKERAKKAAAENA